jgi:hypothetical protein
LIHLYLRVCPGKHKDRIRSSIVLNISSIHIFTASKMRFSPIALGLFGLAAAESLMRRQASTVVNVVNGIDTQVKSLDQAIQAFNGNPQQLLSASQQVLSATQQGVSTVNGVSTLSLNDALTIQQPVQTLTTDLNQTITDLIAKKSALVSAGEGATVEQNLQQQLTAAQQLSQAISSKVPQEVASLAQQLSQGIINAIQAGITAFQGTGGSTSGGSSASGGSGGSAPTSTVGSTGGGGGVTVGSSPTSSSPAVFTGAAMPIKPGQVLGGLAAAVVLAL